MTLKIKMTDQREAGQPDFPFQNQTSCLVTDMMELHPAGWLHAEIHKPGMSAAPRSLDQSGERGCCITKWQQGHMLISPLRSVRIML